MRSAINIGRRGIWATDRVAFARYVGETHEGDAQAQRIETDLRALLAQTGKP